MIYMVENCSVDKPLDINVYLGSQSFVVLFTSFVQLHYAVCVNTHVSEPAPVLGPFAYPEFSSV